MPETLLEAQREYFASGATLPVDNRIQALRHLRRAITDHEEALLEALRLDLGKSAAESYMCEVGMVLEELSYMIDHTRKFARDQRVPTPLAQFKSRSYRKPSPKGCVLIMSPWNYPVLLTLGPMVDALAAGNTVILKPSAYAPHTAAAIGKLIEGSFDPRYVAVVTGGRKENQALLDLPFDHIFFTGSKEVGKTVMAAAGRHLTPVTLELGGKSPCIVTEKADLRIAARRIVFGKYLNCGQTCVAPDYLYVHRSVKDELLGYIKAEIAAQHGDTPLTHPDWGKIINEKHWARLMDLIDRQRSKVMVGGAGKADTLQIAPTVLDNITWEDPIMQDEIFGPILPVLVYDDLEEVVEAVGSHDRPLALYIFTKSKRESRYVLSRCRFGGGCVNDTIIHLATTHMGFGGVGESGMGSYHGKAGFDTFSHHKSIVDKATWLDLSMRYRPYSEWKDRIIRAFLR